MRRNWIPVTVLLGGFGCCREAPPPPERPALARLKLHHYTKGIKFSRRFERIDPEERLRRELEAYFSNVAGDRVIEVVVRYHPEMVSRYYEICGPLRPGQRRDVTQYYDFYSLIIYGYTNDIKSNLNYFIDAAEAHPDIAKVELD